MEWHKIYSWLFKKLCAIVLETVLLLVLSLAFNELCRQTLWHLQTRAMVPGGRVLISTSQKSRYSEGKK